MAIRHNRKAKLELKQNGVSPIGCFGGPANNCSEERIYFMKVAVFMCLLFSLNLYTA